MTSFSLQEQAAAFARRAVDATEVLVCEPHGFEYAVLAAVDRRARGETVNVAIIYTPPRLALLQAIYSSIASSATTHDALVQTLDAFAAGSLSLNERPQATFESQCATPQIVGAFRDLCLIADRVLFRSYHDLEMCSALFGYRPTRWGLFCPPDDLVPQPPETRLMTDEVVLWCADVPGELISAVRAMCFDLRSPLRYLDGSEADAHITLAGARAIVSLSADPATVFALSLFGRPLCVPQGGAGEIVDGLQEFAPWNRLQLVDAILRALGAAAPTPRSLRDRDTAPSRRSRTYSSAPLVSIVMPTYSRPQTLAAGLERLQRQTYENIEIVVVNNAGSPVDDVVSRFPNARLINRDHNTGNATRPRNDGIQASNGKYIALLDDDDVFFDDHIERMVEVLERGAVAAYSDFLVRFVERKSDGTETVWGWDLQKPLGITTFELLIQNRLGYLTIMARREVYEKLGLFDERPEIAGGEEVEYWLRIAASTEFVHVDQPSTAYSVVRDWRGQLSEKSHALYAGGYESVYRSYPADNYPLVERARSEHLRTLRSTATPPPMQPRYLLSAHAS